MQPENKIVSDLLIVGNGISSQFLSLALLRTFGNNLKINVIDKDTLYNNSDEYVRALSISLSTVNICKALDIWDKVKVYCYPVERIDISSISKSLPNDGYLQFNNRISDQIASYIINEKNLREILDIELENFNNIRVFTEDISEINIDQNHAELSTKNKKFIAKFTLVSG